MQKEEIFSKIDHTVLKAVATWDDIKKLCEEAITHKMASVCIPPSYVKKAKEVFGEKLNVCTVIGFPLGYNTTAVKVFETKQAIQEGATEIDMVINICELKNKNFDYIKDEIKQIKDACQGKLLKVIVETCYLTDEEKETLCKIISEVKADYIKTSTGFGTGGATIKDIELFKKHISEDVKMKASGGIKTKEDMQAYINAGCSRIGTSSAITLID